MFNEMGLSMPIHGTIDVQPMPIPDANARLRMKLNKKHIDDVTRKKNLANKVEDHRFRVLENYGVKQALWK